MTDLQTRRDSPEPPSRGRFEYGTGFWWKLGGLALLDALAVYAALILFTNEDWVLLIGLIVLTVLINWVYLWPGTQALRWITPGVTFMLIFLVIPIIFTAFISMTNWSTGNTLTKEQAIEALESRPFVDPEAPGRVLDLFVYQNDAGDLLFLLEGDEERIAAFPRAEGDEPLEDAVLDLEAADVEDTDGDGIPDRIDDYVLLTGPALFGVANEIRNLVVDLPDGLAVVLGTTSVRVIEGTSRFVYDEEADAIVDNVTGQVCPAVEGTFVCEDGSRLDPGFRVFVGLENYADLFTDQRIRAPFLGVFLWNVVFALGSVFFTFALGLSLALVFQHPRIRGIGIYRSIYILPYAIPAFLSILIWRGLLNEQFGQVNAFLGIFGIPDIPWLTSPNWAKAAVLLVNTWLGFTYMFLITTGALASIPDDFKEAARTDGATALQVFRKITFPLLMVSLAPLLIGSFAFNFNNFILIEFLTQGGPPILDAAVPVGATDILISFTFDVAVQSGRGQQFGVGSAITIVIFIVLLIITSISFRFTRRLEDTFG